MSNKATLSDKDAEYFFKYMNEVLSPSYKEFQCLMEDNKLSLHHLFSFNSIIAHAIDYMVFIENKIGSIGRKKALTSFDEKYSVDGSKLIEGKFELIDAVNNSFKHIELCEKRYENLITKYGKLTFLCLKAEAGKVYFEMPNYRFDYARVILRPIASVFDFGMNSKQDLIDFINGDLYGCLDTASYDDDYDYGPHDAIDRMIDYCNPFCVDCGEGGNTCECPSFSYDKISGEFNPDQDPNFDFDTTMSEISPGYKK
jgi:hypothetical protein